METEDTAGDWARIDALLDAALALPADARLAFATRATAGEPALQARMLRLVAALDAPDPLLDRPASETLGGSPVLPDLQPGAPIGAYRILGLLGRGGMGEVYAAERADGQFEQRVAVKLLRRDAAAHLALFASERRILARLEHPGIARLYDAGVAADGRPYMVMEHVAGVPLTEWCREGGVGLRGRLELFLQVCEAVTYAHQHLVIHRDLKPGNILVTVDGRAKLLDFGVAKLLSGSDDAVTLATPVTLAYAAPEQLTDAGVSTATDVHALGVLLFELLTDRLPWPTAGLPIAVAVEHIRHSDPPAPSRVAAAVLPPARPPLPPRALAGDLDAIVARALRKVPRDRYATVAGLQADVERHGRGEPVASRNGARLYVLGRLVRRYRWAVAATVTLIASLGAGLAGTAWQARRAETQAARATATKDFLVSIFRANDVRIASDRPRGEVTARELLDSGNARIEKEFAGQPELQIELLGLTAAIYGNFPDETRYAATQARRMALARAYYGPAHPIVLSGMIGEADAACVRQDYAKANRLLAESDLLLRTSGQDRTALRADWWRTKARALGVDAGGQAARAHALAQALQLYEALAPHSNDYAATLNMASRDQTERGDDRAAERLLEQALAVSESAPDRDDALIANYLNNLARKQEKLGEFAKAEATYDRAESLARRTYGEHHSAYWLTRAYHARMQHQRGERMKADATFEALLRLIPPGWSTTTDPWVVRELYAEGLVAEGRAREALPLLQAAQATYLVRPQYEYDIREVRRKLAEAYDQLGQTDAARTQLAASRDEYLAREPGSLWTLRVRERWGRFLLDHAAPGTPDVDAAAREFAAVVQGVGARPRIEGALAHAGLARIALRRGEAGTARAESDRAVQALDHVMGLYDLRLQALVWDVHAVALGAAGDHAGAASWAERAALVRQRYDAPGSPALALADARLRVARTLLPGAGRSGRAGRGDVPRR